MENNNNVSALGEMNQQENNEVAAKQEELVKIIERLANIEMMLSGYKNLYSEKDELTMQLRELIGTEVEVSHGDLIMKVVDNFSEKNIVFRPTGIRRFELKTESATERTEKLMKAALKASKKAGK